MNSVIPKPKHSAEQREIAGNNILAGQSYIDNLVQVSPKLIKVRTLENLPWWIFFILLASGIHIAIIMLELPPALHLITLTIWPFVLFSIILLPRRVRAIGYVIRENDVVLRTGLLIRKLNIVPFGRVQEINIHEGFWERRYGLSTITLKTASEVSLSVPGLSKSESDQIRDLVTREADQKMAAL